MDDAENVALGSAVRYRLWVNDKIHRVMAKRQPPAIKDVRCFYGDSGSGKTTAALAWLGEDADELVVGADFRGIDETKDAILIDEFSGDRIKLESFKLITDQKPKKIQILRDVAVPMWSKVAIVSQNPPWTWFKKASLTDLKAVWRRFSHIYHFTGDYHEGSNKCVGLTVHHEWKTKGVNVDDVDFDYHLPNEWVGASAAQFNV